MPQNPKIEFTPKILRYPFFLILKNFKDHPEQYIKAGNDVQLEILQSHVTPIAGTWTYGDPTEKKWVNEGPIDYNHAYTVDDHKAEICAAIGTKIGMFSPIRRTPKPQKGGQVQQVLLQKLCPIGDRLIGEKLSLSRPHADALFEHAKKIAKNNHSAKEERALNFLEEEYHKIVEAQQLEQQAAKTIPPADKLHEAFWKKNIPIVFFAKGNLWKVYERITIEKKDNDINRPDHEFMINAVRFYRDNDQTYCQMLNTSIDPNGDAVKGFYHGPATVSGDEFRYLHISLYHVDGNAPCFFILRLKDPDLAKILIGSYHSFSKKRDKYVSKLVVFQRVESSGVVDKNFNSEGDKDLVSTTLRSLTGKLELKQGHKDPDENLQPILNYLSDRHLNRLSMPSQPIRNVKELKEWLDERHKLQNEGKLKKFCRRFIVAYCFEEIKKDDKATGDSLWARVRFDTLEIAKHQFKPLYIASYVHHLKGNSLIYNGEVFMKGQNIEVLISESSGGHTIEHNYGLLNFYTPDSQFDEIDEHEFFSGIISGLSDRPIKPVAYRVMVFIRKNFLIDENKKANVENIKKECKECMESFFQEYSGNLLIGSFND